VITSYNKGPYIRAAIDSALSQDHVHHEVIVVDDGSTDDTGAIAATYGERIKYHRQANAGPAGAKNRGILLSQGEFIAFLDGDDRWRPGKLWQQLQLFDARRMVGVVYGRSVNTCELAQAESQTAATLYRGNVLDALLVRNFVPFSSAVVRRECLAQAGLLDPRLRVADDYDFWLRVARHCEFDFVDSIVVEYRTEGDRIGSRTSLQAYCDVSIQVQRSFVDRFFHGSYPRPDIYRRGIAAKLAELGDCQLGAGNSWQALNAHWRALCVEPLNAWRYKDLARDLIPNRWAGPIRRYLIGGLRRRAS
jgi:glycosyltransferase involved in cell wall biosynthesis